jgi:antirestriction protein ArdC
MVATAGFDLIAVTLASIPSLPMERPDTSAAGLGIQLMSSVSNALASAAVSSSQSLVANLIALLQQGTTPWRRPWRDGQSQHVNLFTGRPYRGGNPLLLTLGQFQRGALEPFWCGFAEARRHGLVPRRGCKAVFILKPMVLPESADKLENEAPRRRAIFRTVAVFNAADLIGETLASHLVRRRSAAALLKLSPSSRLERAEETLHRWPVPCRYGGDQAGYVPDRDTILLPERDCFDSAAGFYATWAHEAIHSTGHHSRLNRDMEGTFGSDRYAREELIAELGAVLVGTRLEIGCDLRNHAAYLDHWIRLLQEQPGILLPVLQQARLAADLITPEEPYSAGQAHNTAAGCCTSRQEPQAVLTSTPSTD